MSDCPSGLELDAWFIERTPGPLADHIAQCELCAGYIARLESEDAAFIAAEAPEAFVHRPAIAAELNRPEPVQRSFWSRFGWSALASIAAAAVALLVMIDRGKTNEDVLTPDTPAPDIVRIKGKTSLAVVLKRGDSQTRHTGTVRVKPGDEIRVELNSGEVTTLTVGIRTDDGQWMPLNEGFQSRLGSEPVHDDAIAFDEEATRGWIIAGAPDAITHALAQGILDSDDLIRLRIEWEGE